jgi:hypothetical protein
VRRKNPMNESNRQTEEVACEGGLDREENGEAEIDVLQQAQRAVEPRWHPHRLQHHHSCIAPSGHTPPQKARPKNRATTRGRKKVAVTTIGMEYAESVSATATF